MHFLIGQPLKHRWPSAEQAKLLLAYYVEMKSNCKYYYFNGKQQSGLSVGRHGISIVNSVSYQDEKLAVDIFRAAIYVKMGI